MDNIKYDLMIKTAAIALISNPNAAEFVTNVFLVVKQDPTIDFIDALRAAIPDTAMIIK